MTDDEMITLKIQEIELAKSEEMSVKIANSIPEYLEDSITIALEIINNDASI